MMTPHNTWNNKYINLSGRAGRITSENKTDGLILALFEICIPQNKWCVEVGAFDGYTGSNTYNLIDHGWKSLQIEGSPPGGKFTSYDLLRNRYINSSVICVNVLVRPDHFGSPDEFSMVLERSGIPETFDFLSLDVDGIEYEIWKATRYKPNVILVECNSIEESFDVIGYDPSYSVREQNFAGYNPDHYGGATVGLLSALADYKGYDLLCVDNNDALYINREFGKPLEK